MARPRCTLPAGGGALRSAHAAGASLIVEDGLIRLGAGAALGLGVLAVGVRSGFAGLLTVATADPWLWLSLVAVLAFVATAACYVPASRATSADLMVALRSE